MLAAVKDCITYNRNLNFLNKNGVALVRERGEGKEEREGERAVTILYFLLIQLHIASANGYYRIAKLLLDGGANIDVVDDLGYTPLHVAAKFNQVGQLINCWFIDHHINDNYVHV